MLSLAKSATARLRDRLNGFKNGKTQLFNSWGVVKWVYFQKKWSVPLKAQKIQRNIILTGYCLHVAILHVCKTTSALSKATASCAPRVHGTGALHIHWDKLKNNTNRLTESKTLKRSVRVFGEWKYICAKLILSLQRTHWWVKSDNLLAIG